jgi:hypothetical protein
MTTLFAAPHARTESALVESVRLRALRRVRWLQAVWAETVNGAAQELAITDSEVERLLAEPATAIAAEERFYTLDPETRELSHDLAEAEAQLEADPRWATLCAAFDLSRPERHLLALAAAVAIAPDLRRVYGYLHDDATLQEATPALAAQLFAWESNLFIPHEGPLARWWLARPAEASGTGWSALSPWSVDPLVAGWLIGQDGLDPTLDGAVEWHPCPMGEESVCLFPTLLNEIADFVSALRDAAGNRSGDPTIAIELVGPAGSGRRTLAAQIAAERGTGVLIADVPALVPAELPREVARERIARAGRLARLHGGILCWSEVTAVEPRLLGEMRVGADIAIFTAERAMSSVGVASVVHCRFTMPTLTSSDRTGLWERLAGRSAPTELPDWQLTPGELAAAARVAPAGAEAVATVCRQLLHPSESDLFTPLPCPFTWDDIVLAPTVRQHLAELEAQARLRVAVYDEWGFARLIPLGRGITALFAGPSGTGKTMAAQVLAHVLGLELLRVDLAGVVNKYIGETEKRLRAVFAACERAGVLLLFDEADALFGKRTQTKDAHDRFANIEIDYLLQRMEQFDGLAVLATNRKSDLDPAFLRRLRFIVDFLPPGPEQRLQLWRRALPEQTPAGEPLLGHIDWDILANLPALTGAEITNAALAAAFLARSEGIHIAMAHIRHAVRRELSKKGVAARLNEEKG